MSFFSGAIRPSDSFFPCHGTFATNSQEGRPLAVRCLGPFPFRYAWHHEAKHRFKHQPLETQDRWKNAGPVDALDLGVTKTPETMRRGVAEGRTDCRAARLLVKTSMLINHETPRFRKLHTCLHSWTQPAPRVYVQVAAPLAVPRAASLRPPKIKTRVII